MVYKKSFYRTLTIKLDQSQYNALLTISKELGTPPPVAVKMGLRLLLAEHNADKNGHLPPGLQVCAAD